MLGKRLAVGTCLYVGYASFDLGLPKPTVSPAMGETVELTHS